MKVTFKIKYSEWLITFFIALLTAVASEIKVIPFSGVDFRFGLGSIAFFFLLLVLSPKYPIRTGIVTGLAVVLFRSFMETFMYDINMMMKMIEHAPAFLFYVIFAFGFHFVKRKQYETMPFLLGLYATCFEFIGNGAEYVIRFLLQDHFTLSLSDWGMILGVGLLRSYFVVGLYSSITMYEQKKRMNAMLNISSNLYGESLYLQKSMNHIENITAASFELSRTLKKEGLERLSERALRVAQEIHEVKKDVQRVLSGLIKVTHHETEPLSLSELLHFVVIANNNYSELLKKNITFQLKTSIDFQTDKQIPLLTILNNLVANAVEAILNEGIVQIEMEELNGNVYFFIKNTGSSISDEEVSVLFEPGYTTKFNDEGVAATGIGLSHVKEIAQLLGGGVFVHTEDEWTTFEVQLPLAKLKSEVE